MLTPMFICADPHTYKGVLCSLSLNDEPPTGSTGGLVKMGAIAGGYSGAEAVHHKPRRQILSSRASKALTGIPQCTDPFEVPLSDLGGLQILGLRPWGSKSESPTFLRAEVAAARARMAKARRAKPWLPAPYLELPGKMIMILITIIVVVIASPRLLLFFVASGGSLRW